MLADEKRDSTASMRSATLNDVDPVIVRPGLRKRMTAEVDGSRGSKSFNEAEPLKKTTSSSIVELTPATSSSKPSSISVKVIQELDQTTFSPSPFFEVVKEEPTFIPHCHPSEYTQLQLSNYNRESVRQNLMKDAGSSPTLNEMKGEPCDQSEKENKVKSEEKQKEEEYVRKFIQAVQKIHPKAMPKHDLFYRLCDRQLRELAVSYRNKLRRINQKAGRDGDSPKFIKLCQDIADVIATVPKDKQTKRLDALRDEGCILVPHTADGRIQIQRWTSDDRVSIKKIYPQNMLYILFNPYAEFTQESDYSKPCQIYSRYCEDDDSKLDKLPKGKTSYICFNPLHWYPQLTREEFQAELAKIIEKINESRFALPTFKKDLEKWVRTIYSLFVCGANSSANSFIEALKRGSNLREKNISAELHKELSQMSIRDKVTHAKFKPKESLLYQINLSACKPSYMFGDCCYIRFSPAYKGKDLTNTISEIRLGIMQFFRPDLEITDASPAEINAKWAKCVEKYPGRYCCNPDHCEAFTNNKVVEENEGPDMKTLEIQHQTKDKAEKWCVISFVRFTDKKSDTESQEKRAFIHSKFYCYFPWSGDILQDNMKMALKNSRENPDEHAEDKEFPLVFSRVRIKPTSCNYDEENNFDRRRKTGKFTYSSKFNLMKTDFDDYGSKYCIKSLKEDPSHEYCLNPNRISRYCSHSYKQNMNTISHYLKKLSKKDDYDLEMTMRVGSDEKQFENLRNGVDLNYSVWLKNHGRRSAYVSLSIENRFELSERVPKDSVQEIAEVLLDPNAVLFIKIPDSKSERVLFHYSGGPLHEQFKTTVEIMYRENEILLNPATMFANPDHLTSVYILYKWNYAKKEIKDPKKSKEHEKEKEVRKEKEPKKEKDKKKEKNVKKEKPKKIKQEEKKYEDEGLLDFDVFKLHLKGGAVKEIYRLKNSCCLNKLEYLQIVSSPKEYAVNQYRKQVHSKTNSN